MKKFPIVLDLETKHTFREFNDPKKLGISVVAIYDYKDNKGKVFEEKELNNLFPILENASYIVGYNVRSFDIAVLQAYYPGNVEHFQVFDILEDIREKIGRRLALNDVIYATFGKRKSGHGLMAIDYYKEGKWDELKKYCLDDTMLTKELFDYGIKFREINYLNEVGKISIKVDWGKYLEESENNDMPLTLPF
ncbi:MAG: ribonuclease H-like domain-containing protein [bacterium]|nr:ribonuclease H-like domain-containing protein [bacterium]